MTNTFPESSLSIVGKSVKRLDAPDKVKGTAKYIDDLSFTGMLYGAVVRSPHPHAEILEIKLEKALKVKGVAGIYTAKDIPGKNIIPLIHQDQPLLAEKTVNHIGEGIAVIAGESLLAAKSALEAVKIKYKSLTPTLTIEEAWEKQDILTHWTIANGNVEKIFQDPGKIIIEDTYYTPYQEHAYLETNGMIAVLDGLGGIIVYGSLQCPFYVQNAVAAVLGIPLNKVRIIQVTTGGGFGGKEDSPSLPAAMAALMAWKSGRPVKLIFEREEDMAVMSKRHPARIHYKSAVYPDGRLAAVEVNYCLNGGAYATLSPVVLWRGAVHAAGPYKVPNVKINAYALKTNTIPCGAFRGFGEPQAAFASESQMDRLAEKLCMDPLEFRLKNILRKGEQTITGQKVETSMGFEEVIEKVTARADWRHNQPDNFTRKRGIGIALTYYGVGLGARGKHLNPAGANVVIAPDGSVTIAVGTTELGQGMFTVLAQIASETLNCPIDLIRVIEPDTSRVPDSGPTVASRTTLMSGNAVKNACLEIKAGMEKALSNENINKLQFQEAVAECIKKSVHLAAHGWAVPPGTTFDEVTGQGNTYITYTWSATIAETEVDIETGEVKVIKIVSGHDIGKVINPQMGEGQIEGGVMQGVGYALTEEHIVNNGKILNNQFSTYLIPVAPDTPEIIPVIVENPFHWGPYGAKGLGEAPLIGVAPAITNSIANAIGIRLNEIPATPERIWHKLQEKRKR